MADPGITLRIRADGREAQAQLDKTAQGLRTMGEAAQRSEVGLGIARKGVQSISTQLDSLQGQVKGYIAAQFGLQQVTQSLAATDTYQRLSAVLRPADRGAGPAPRHIKA